MKSPGRCGWSWFIALGALVVRSSIAHAEPRLPTHVACVGDSITAGAGASASAKNYPSVLQTLFGGQVQIKNFGHSGATMLSKPYGDLPYQDQPEYQGATAFVTGAGANAVVDVIIMLGTNDSKPFNWTPTGKPKNDQQYLKDYRAMVEHFTALTPKPVVYLALPLATGTSPCCSISGTVIHDEVLPLIKQLAVEKMLPTIDLNTPTTGHSEYFGDGVHPNDAAYAIVAQLMHDGLLLDSTGSGGGAGGANSGGGSGFAGAPSAGAGNSSGGSAGNSSGGSAGTASAGAAAGGAPASAGAAGSGVAVAGAAGAGVVPRLPPASDSGGCAVARGNRAGFSLSAAALLGLALLGARRRRMRVTMC